MKTTIWLRRKMTIFAGGDPNKGEAPELTIELNHPQIMVDPEKGIIIIKEKTK